MNETKKQAVVSKITGALVTNNVSSLEALEILEQAKETFLDRSYHVASYEKQNKPTCSSVQDDSFKNGTHVKGIDYVPAGSFDDLTPSPIKSISSTGNEKD